MKNRIFLIVLVSLLSNFLIVSCAKKIQLKSYMKNNYAWLMYGQNPERKFFIDDTLKLPLKINFKTELKAGLNYSSLTAMDEFLFIGDLKGNIYKLDLNTGQLKNFNSFKQPIHTSIIVSENRLAFPLAATRGNNSYLIIYDLIRGEEVSRVSVEGSIEKEILPVNQNIFLTTTKGFIYKLNKNYGVDWKLNLGSLIYSHPAAGEDFIVTATIEGNLNIINFNGEIIQKIKLDNPIKSGFAVEGTKIFFGDDGGFINCYDKQEKKFLYSKKLDVAIKAIPSLDNQNIYVGDLKGYVFCLNKDSGKLMWKKYLGGLINNSILIVGDKLVVPNLHKKIYILDKRNGQILEEIECEGRIKLSPIFVKNKLIIGYDDKKIVALTN